MMGRRQRLVDGWELEWVSKWAKKYYSSWDKAGKGKYVKRKMNKRFRKEGVLEIEQERENP